MCFLFFFFIEKIYKYKRTAQEILLIWWQRLQKMYPELPPSSKHRRFLGSWVALQIKKIVWFRIENSIKIKRN
jgi:hypothetical protein